MLGALLPLPTVEMGGKEGDGRNYFYSVYNMVNRSRPVG